MDVIILAGGICPPELEKISGTHYRSMIPIQGKPILHIIKEATKFLGEPIIVGGPKGESSRQVDQGNNSIESLLNGIKLVTTEKALIVTSDLPCLSQEAINDFLNQCNGDAAFFYPIVDVSQKDVRFDGMKRTTLKLREGCFTGGNIMLVDKQQLLSIIPMLERTYELRKKPIKIAQMVGFGALLRVVIGQLFPFLLPLKDVEKSVSRFLTKKIVGVISRYPELGADIDNAEQYQNFINTLNNLSKVTDINITHT